MSPLKVDSQWEAVLWGFIAIAIWLACYGAVTLYRRYKAAARRIDRFDPHREAAENLMRRD